MLPSKAHMLAVHRGPGPVPANKALETKDLYIRNLHALTAKIEELQLGCRGPWLYNVWYFVAVDTAPREMQCLH